jgi:excisionase family DNA binding protein
MPKAVQAGAEMTPSAVLACELLTVRQVSEATGIPRDTLYGHFAPRGDLPIVRPGHTIYVRRDDLEAWISKHRVAPAKESIARAVTRRAISDLPGADRYVS